MGRFITENGGPERKTFSFLENAKGQMSDFLICREYLDRLLMRSILGREMVLLSTEYIK